MLTKDELKGIGYVESIAYEVDNPCVKCVFNRCGICVSIACSGVVWTDPNGIGVLAARAARAMKEAVVRMHS
jgi:hypothetical protein